MIQVINTFMARLLGQPDPLLLIDAENVTDECFTQIFKRLDNKSLLNCMLACHRFEKLLKVDSFWVEKARYQGIEDVLPSITWRKAAAQNKFKGNEDGAIDTTHFHFDIKQIVASGRGYASYERDFAPLFQREPNQVRTGTFRNDDFLIRSAGSGIQMESDGGASCEHHPDVTNCFSFSFATSYMFAFVDLRNSGIDDWVMDYVRPKIRITQMVNHRHDCSASLTFAAQLNAQEATWTSPSEESGPQCKTIRKEWEQWSEVKWEEWTLEFDDYPSGLRHLIIKNEGRDGQYWRGFYGPKIANLRVEVIMPEETVLKKWETPSGTDQAEVERLADDPRPRVHPLHRLRGAWQIPAAIYREAPPPDSDDDE
ncbi:unnamed protein product [Caenorhabditis sp. 36 PRJEB53466]|nr:unnamed protein product [Caenorhabditis sp. 36 PRJEB53466]